eukprot:8590659-Pyramimonas_sp.AAC.1
MLSSRGRIKVKYSGRFAYPHQVNPASSRPSPAPQADSHRRDEPSARESQEGRAFSSSLQGVSHSFKRDEPSAR